MKLHLILPRLLRILLAAAVITPIAAAGAATLRPADDEVVIRPVSVSITPPQTVKPGVELRLQPVPAHRAAKTRAAAPIRAVAQPRRTGSLTIPVIAEVPIQQGTAWVNKCAGAIAATYPGVPPQIVQHDYCGGLWVLGLHNGEHIRFTGAVSGLYVVNGRRAVIADGTLVTAGVGLGDLIAQTCIPGTSTIQWVGLTRIGA